MNSFETDMQRALVSRGFLIAFIIECVILMTAGPESELFRISIPVVCTFPYTTSMLTDLQSGYIKSYLVRSSTESYIWGKLLSCMLSGGLVEVLAVLVYATYSNSSLPAKLFLLRGGSILSAEYPGTKEPLVFSYGLIFLSGAFWALFATTCALIVKSKYLAYGSSFVFYYILIILQERYCKKLYCINPEEWFRYQHEWIFDKWGIVILLGLLMWIFIWIYRNVARRYLVNV